MQVEHLTSNQEISNKSEMKNSFFLLASTIIYTLLFYDQDCGLNYFLFSIVIAAILIFRDRTLLRNPKFITVLFMTILTGSLVLYYGTWYSVWMNKISILLMASFAYQPASSMIIALFNGIFSYISLPIRMLLDFLSLRFQSFLGLSKGIKYAMLTVIPVIIALVFLGIYSLSNPILSSFLSQINLNFISASCILFMAYAFFICYGLLLPSKLNKLTMTDLTTKDDLYSEEQSAKEPASHFLSVNSEAYIAVTVFILLNMVIGLNNGLDIYYLFIKKVLPTGLTYTSFLHQGVNALICSIFLAIGLIMYFFSSRLNFIPKANYLKLAAYLWIIQNVFLTYLCFYKNYQYIDQFGLTYKRLGVYTFLALAVMGLGLTFYKILKNKSNLFLVRKNSWVAYIGLVLLGTYDWDYAIIHNNLTSNKDQHIDYNYLLSLDHSGLPLIRKHLFIDDQDYQNTMRIVDSVKLKDGDYAYFTMPKEKAVDKIEAFKAEMKAQNWQSFSILETKVNNKLLTTKNI